MKSLLITGANRGLGLELVKQFLNHETSKPEILIATARVPNEAKELNELASQDKSLHILQLDVNKFDTFKEFSEQVSKIVGEQGLNVLFNNAGILLERENILQDVTADLLRKHFETNTIAPILLTQTLLPLVKKAAQTKSRGISVDRAALIYMSALLGSVKCNEGEYGFKYWGYRESKAALDMAARTIHKEVSGDGIGVLVLHPGWVQTDMGGPNAPITATHSIQGVVKVILSLNEKNDGTFIQHDGSQLPW